MGIRNAEIGRVVSNKMDKTVVVVVERQSVHRLYKKAVRRLKRFKAHDENNTCQIGDQVRIEETRPTSKDKRWRVMEILVSGFGAELAPSTEREVKAIQEALTPEVVEESEDTLTEEARNETDSDADVEEAAAEADEEPAEADEQPAEDADSEADADAEEKEESS